MKRIVFSANLTDFVFFSRNVNFIRFVLWQCDSLFNLSQIFLFENHFCLFVIRLNFCSHFIWLKIHGALKTCLIYHQHKQRYLCILKERKQTKKKLTELKNETKRKTKTKKLNKFIRASFFTHRERGFLANEKNQSVVLIKLEFEELKKKKKSWKRNLIPCSIHVKCFTVGVWVWMWVFVALTHTFQIWLI